MRMRTSKMRGRVVIGVVCLVVAGTLAACGSSSDGGSSGGGGSGQKSNSSIVIGYLPTGLSLPIIADAYHAAEDEAKQLGVQFKAVADPQYETAEGQNNEGRQLLAQGIDALVIDPADSHAIGTLVQAANREDVPVIMQIGGDTGAGHPETYMAANETKGEYRASVAIFKMLGGNGNVAYIQGDIAQEAGALREKGFRQALKQYPNINLVAYGSAGFSEPQAQKLATDMLTAHPDLQAIITAYDGMTDGALAAANAAHQHLLLAGVDGECQTLSDIWRGTETLTVDELWTNIGAQSVKVAVQAAKGKHLPPRIYTPSFIITKHAEQQILKGTFPGEIPALKSQIQQAVHGCPSG